jgi:hypothetical protein
MTEVRENDPGYLAAPEGPNGSDRLAIPVGHGPSVAYGGPDAAREPG